VQISQIYALLDELKAKGMQAELFQRNRKYPSVVYHIRNERGIITKSEEILLADYDKVQFDRFRKELQKNKQFIKALDLRSITKLSETYLLKDSEGIQIGWFDLEEGRKGINDAIHSLRKACLKYSVIFTPDIPSDEPFPHRLRRKRARAD
jgi:hypothetical protein